MRGEARGDADARAAAAGEVGHAVELLGQLGIQVQVGHVLLEQHGQVVGAERLAGGGAELMQLAQQVGTDQLQLGRLVVWAAREATAGVAQPAHHGNNR